MNASVSFDPKAFTVDVRLQQQGSSACRDSTVRAMNISKDGGIGAIKVIQLLFDPIKFHAVQQDGDTTRSRQIRHVELKNRVSCEICYTVVDAVEM